MKTLMQTPESLENQSNLDVENWAVLLELEREKQRREQHGERPFLELPLPLESEKSEEPITGGNVIIISI